MRCLIVHNKHSGFGSDAVFAFERELVRSGDECLLRVVGESFVAAQAVADAEAFDVVVLSGGDGTVSSLLWELRDRAVPTCVFPSGTANLLFSNIGNSPEPAALARACRFCHTASCDLGEISWEGPEARGSRGFSLMAGGGFDAELMRSAAPNKRTMGEAAYFFAALADPVPPVVHYALDVDGRHIERDGIACLVANNATIQGDIEVVPGCVMDDGLLDVIVLETTDAVQLVRPLLAGLFDHKGRGGRPRIESFKARHVRVSASAPIPMQVDGEVVASAVRSWEARALPDAARLIVDGLSRYGSRADGADPAFPIAKERAFPR